ncbi:MAG: hypothetical protein CFH22_00658 [Alphaproteobacteria bacterium MarineAlpha5_Bin12]|mgnify:CR=1 FL=1|nr:MAG: hypothetical protein CFH22_00658 [Alphaproteobacteria bacterium MarineAlpha5_Bin12]
MIYWLIIISGTIIFSLGMSRALYNLIFNNQKYSKIFKKYNIFYRFVFIFFGLICVFSGLYVESIVN